MALGTSLFLIAVGAILKWAITVDTEGIELDTVGVILMVVGIIGLLLSLITMVTGSGPATVVRRERTVERDRDPRAPH